MKCTIQKTHGTSWRSFLNWQYFFKTHLGELIGLGCFPLHAFLGNGGINCVKQFHIHIWESGGDSKENVHILLFSNVIQIIEFVKLKEPYLAMGINTSLMFLKCRYYQNAGMIWWRGSFSKICHPKFDVWYFYYNLS